MQRLFTSVVAGLLLALGSTAALAAGEINLVSSRSYGCPPVSGCFGTPFFQATLEVSNMGYAKQVGVHSRNAAGNWVSTAGQFLQQVSPERELWTVNLSAPGSSAAFYYTVNGTTYWDNNGGLNYQSALYQYDAQLGSVPLGDPQGSWLPPESGTSQNGAISGNLLIRNLSYAKTVRIVYTENNWTTTREAFASYQVTLPSGIELWRFSLPTAATVNQSQVQMAFQYTWATGSAWDNNYGRNYRLNSIITR